MVKRIVGLVAVALGGAVLFAQSVWADCTCRYDGNSYEYGTVVCLRMPDGVRLARCGMVQNNTFWDFLDQPCPLASLTPRPSRDRRIASRVTRPSVID